MTATFKTTTVKHMFPTPLVISELPDDLIASVNPALKKMIIDRSEADKGVHVSNVGGWQSDDRLPEWGGEPVETIVTCMRDLLSKISVFQKGLAFERGKIDWRVSGWANINRKGNSNVPHAHPGAFWSAVYYVSVDPSTDKGGDIEFLDPRGHLPKMYCPILYMGIDGYMSAGASEIHKPKEGQCIIFPSWLTHAVMPYIGDTLRISLAFNFSI